MVWIIFLAIAVPIVAVLLWIALDDSFVRIEPGQLGLLLIKGKATDKALEPGPHWVPAMRRRTVQTYPSTEMSYRAGAPDTTTVSMLERAGPSIRTSLVDRSTATASYTVRFRLDTPRLRTVHDRFGPEGIWSAVRDESEAAMREALGGATIDDLFGGARAPLEQRLATVVGQRLDEFGIVVTMLQLGDIDLGRTGEVIEATARARLELEREQAEAAMRIARARIDADLTPFVGAAGSALALRYREVDSWREVARTGKGMVPAPGRSSGSDVMPVEDDAPDATVDDGEAEQ